MVTAAPIEECLAGVPAPLKARRGTGRGSGANLWTIDWQLSPTKVGKWPHRPRTKELGRRLLSAASSLLRRLALGVDELAIGGDSA